MISRAQPLRTALAAALLFALAAGLAIGLLSPPPSAALSRRPAPRLSAQASDSVHIYGPAELVWATDEDPTPMWLVLSDNFSADSLAGWRYVVEMVPGVTGILGASFSVNGQQWVGRGQYGSLTTRLLQEVDVTAGSNSYACELRGTPGASVWVRIVRVKDPTYRVYGRTVLVRPSSSGTPQVQPFSTTATGGPPYTLHAVNGDAANLHRITSGTVSLNGTQVLGNADFGTLVAGVQRDVNLHTAGTQDTLTVVNSSAAGTRGTFWVTATDTTPPTLTVSSPAQETTYTEASSQGFTGRVSDAVPGFVTVPGAGTWATPDSFSLTLPLPADGCYPATVTATSASGLGSAVHRVVYRDTHPPDLKLWPAQDTTVTQDHVTLDLTWADTTLTVVSVDGVQVGHSAYGRWTSSYALDLGPNGIFFRARDALGHLTQFKRLVNYAPADTVPVSPTVPQLAATKNTGFRAGIGFLYNGTHPAQSALDTTRLVSGMEAVIRGTVVARDFGAVPNVTVRVLDHPEYGYAKTQSDGHFDLVVNGGTDLVLRLLKPGYLEAQRRVSVPVQDFAIIDTVALMGRSARALAVDSASPMAVAGRFESDANGDRQLLMLVPAGTVCSLTPPGESPIQFTQYNVRMKEYTVGANGAATMPGPLPPASAYTYCVEMSVDTADAMTQLGGAIPDVSFNKLIVTYSREFLGIPVGSQVPSGYYDRNAARWRPSENGRVVSVVGIANGMANLDTDGIPGADSLPQYQALGIDSTERAQVASTYAVGVALWRVRVNHFCALDYNFNEAQMANAGVPIAATAAQLASLVGDPTATCGCVIEDENRVLGETIPITGTPFALHYRSDRQPGDRAMRTIRIPLTGPVPDSSLRAVHGTVDVAGRRFRYDERATPSGTLPVNRVWTLSDWDGTDVFDRPVQGSVEATVRVGYEFGEIYIARLTGGRLGQPAGGAGGWLAGTTGDRDVGRILWSTQRVSLGAPSMASAGLGGWTISPQHFYDVNGRGTLYLGDGSIRFGNRQFPIVHNVAGNGSSRGQNPSQHPDEGSLATSGLVSPEDMVFGPNGSLYLTDPGAHLVARVAPDGRYYRVAGDGSSGNPGAGGGVATSTSINNPRGLAVGPDGSVYFCDPYNLRVYQVDPGGILRSVLGTGNSGTFIEAATPSQEPLGSPAALALGVDGTLYVADNNRIMQLGADDTVRTFAGTGQSDDGYGHSDIEVEGRADSLPLLTSDMKLATDRNGNVFATTGSAGSIVYRFSPDGRRSNYVHVQDLAPQGIALGSSGAMFIAQNYGGLGETGKKSVLRREQDGSLSLVVGGLSPRGAFLESNDNFARAATYANLTSVAVDATGNICVGQTAAGNYADATGIQRIAPDQPGAIEGEIAFPSEDASEIFYFNIMGQHQRTVDATTGVVRYRFRYDDGGRLASIYDVNGDSTHIVRDGDGEPTAIIAPRGQTTAVTTQTFGGTARFLGSAANPNGETFTLTPDANGLLGMLVNPRGKTWQFYYGADGRLSSETDPAGGGNTLTPPDPASIAQTVTRSTNMGRVTSYTITQMLDGLRHRLVRQPDHAVDSSATTFLTASPFGEEDLYYGAAGETTFVRPVRSPDGRVNWLAPLAGTSTTRLPGSKSTMTVTRGLDAGSPRVDTLRINANIFTTTWNSGTATLTATTPEGRSSSLQLDAAGRPTSIAVNGGTLAPISLHYDAHGRLDRLEQAGRGWRYGYDGLGRLQTVSDSLHRRTSYGYDAADRVTSQHLPGGRTVAYGYDASGNLTSLTPPGADAHAFAYTPVDLNESYTPPAVAGIADPASRYAFNVDRQLTDVTRPDGSMLRARHDSQTGQLDSLTQARGKTTFTYSAATGQLLTSTSPDGVGVSYGYDGPLLRSEAWTGLRGGGAVDSVSTLVNNDFRPSLQTVDGSLPVTWAYDRDGLLDTLTVNGATESITHRASDGLVSNTSVGTGPVTSTHSYSLHGELSRLSYAWPGGGRFEQELVRDSLGRIVQVIETGIATHTFDYHYDDPGRLDTVRTDGTVTQALEYDRGLPGNGNRTRFGPAAGDTASYDAQDRMLQYGSRTYAYTAAGELVRRVGGTTDSLRTTYDALGNLTGAHATSGDSIRYLVDGENRRVARIVNGQRTHTWLYQNGLNVIAEVDDATGTLVSRYAYGTRAHVPDLLVRSGVTYRLLTDQLGSVRAVVRVSDGTVMQRTDYDAWGVITYDSSASFQSLGYAGGLEDRSTGLVRFGARDYEPGVGRWTAKDPVACGGGSANACNGLYVYGVNAPINGIDPTGLLWEYSQSSGALIYVDDDTGARTPVGAGYSGQGVGLNNPSFVAEPNVGPIPEGWWTIGPPQYDDHLGNPYFHLTPDPSTGIPTRRNAHSFYIHADNAAQDASASKGCIVLGRSPRLRRDIAKSGDKRLKVVR